MTTHTNNWVGSPARVLVSDVIHPILQILSVATQKIVAEKLVNAQQNENTITEQLCKTMIEEKNRRNATLRIEEEVGTFHTIAGRIDFKIIYDFDERNYFGIECKRLSGQRKGQLDREYVTEGLMRFVDGKYSQGHPWGMMLGYVIDGTCQRAIELVQERVDEYRNQLRVEAKFDTETQFGDYLHLYHSRHRQNATNELISLLHYFFALMPASG